MDIDTEKVDDPVGKQKSVVFTDTGLRQAERSFRQLSAKKNP
jgi:hypothetical protein